MIFTALRTVSLWSKLRKQVKRRSSEKIASQTNDISTPPIAMQQLERMTVHGVEIVDPYSWMQDIQHPRIQKYLQEEQQYTERVMSPTISLQKLFYRVHDRPCFLSSLLIYCHISQGEDSELYYSLCVCVCGCVGIEETCPEGRS
jgi:hypothetical protein